MCQNNYPSTKQKQKTIQKQTQQNPKTKNAPEILNEFPERNNI